MKVLHGVSKRQITPKQAAAQMGVTERCVRKLLARMRKEGDRAVIHRLHGRVSNRKIPERVHTWRPRRAQAGELVQWDSSEQDWLEGRGEKLSLIALINDATSRALARFVRHDSTQENLRLLRAYLRRWGRPGAFYTDKASLFRTPRPPQSEERLYLPLWNRRFTVAAANPTDAHRPLGPEHHLAGILSHMESRVVDPDHTVPWEGHRYQIARAAIRAGLQGVRVRMQVEKRLDGSIAVRFREHYLPVSVCEPRREPNGPVQPAPRSPKPASNGRPHRWMEGFDLQRSKPIWAILRQEQARPHQGDSGVRR